MLFEWDENKNYFNKLKHRISFEMASHVFDDENLLTELDIRHVYFEERWRTIGATEDILLSVIHTVEHCYDEETIRIISARKAHTKETRRYYYDR